MEGGSSGVVWTRARYSSTNRTCCVYVVRPRGLKQAESGTRSPSVQPNVLNTNQTSEVLHEDAGARMGS